MITAIKKVKFKVLNNIGYKKKNQFKQRWHNCKQDCLKF